jgi:PAS domain S-box-containing protein
MEEQIYVDANQAFLQMAGATDQDQLIGEHVSVLWPEHQPDGTPTAEYVQRLMTQGMEEGTLEFTFYNKSIDGREYWSQTSASYLEIDGRPHFQLSSRDINEEVERKRRLEEGKERLQTLFDNSPVGICITTPEGNFEQVNDTYTKIYGYSKDELIGQPFTLVTKPNDEQFWTDKHDRFIAGTDEVTGEFNVLTKDGRELTILANSARIAGEDGRLRKVTYVTDITDRKKHEADIKQANEELRAAEEELRQNMEELEASRDEIEERERNIERVVSASPNPIVLSSLEDSKVKLVNDRLCDLIGLPREKLLGRSTPDFYYNPEDRKKLLQQVQKEGLVRGFELQIKDADGVPNWYEISIRIIEYMGHQTLLAVLNPIGDRIRARRQRERLEKLLERQGYGYWDWNLLTGEVYFSDQWKQMLGYEPDELDNSFDTFAELAHDEDMPKVTETINNYLEDKIDEYSVEVRMKQKNGRYRIILSEGIKETSDDGTPVMLSGTHCYAR